MPDFISPLFWYILTIGILVTVHEWGHFAVARRCGVRVLRFSVGFGRALYSRIGKDGVKVLGNGDLGVALNVRVAKVTAGAQQKVVEAGGTVA